MMFKYCFSLHALLFVRLFEDSMSIIRNYKSYTCIMDRHQDLGLTILLAATQRQGGVTIYIISLSTGHIIRTPAQPIGIRTAQ